MENIEIEVEYSVTEPDVEQENQQIEEALEQ
jgi:hypothetical protein